MSIQNLTPAELSDLRRQLQQFARTRLRDDQAVEDVVQETFLSAMTASGTFEGRSKLKTWMTSILINRIVDHYRASTRTRDLFASAAIADDDESDTPDAYADHHPDWRQEPSRQLESRQGLEAAWNELRKLPPRGARAVVMADVEGRDTGELCGALGVSENNLWVILHRARQALRQGLRAEYA